MGWVYEVEAWESSEEGLKYKYVSYYMGDSLIKAIYWMIKLKINGASCVKLEWR